MTANVSRQGPGRRGTRALLVCTLLTAGVFLDRGPAARAKDPPRGARPAAAVASSPGSDLAEAVGLINSKLKEQWDANKITPSRRADDYEFLRRASLDIIGRIAKPEEIARYLRDPVNTRRAQLIERLLASEEYADNWADIWTVLLMTRSGSVDTARYVYHKQMHYWLKEQFARNASFKEMVFELLTATGPTNDNGAVNYILAHLGEPIPPDKQKEEGYFDLVPLTSRTTRVFLGIQTQCTQCHNHPFNPDRKQNQFWGVNAFFRQVKREGRNQMRKPNRMMEAPVYTLVDDATVNPEGIVFFERRDGVLLPTRGVFLDGQKLSAQTGVNRRQALAHLITGSDYFAKAFVNRLWGHFFGRGIVQPVDDFGEHNPPSHPELLDELAKKFEQYGYDPKKLIRWICHSDAYNLSCVANASNDKADDEKYFSRMLLKALTPEQLYESVQTAARVEIEGSPEPRAGRRNRQRRDWLSKLIVNFGDDEGNEATFNGTVVQALLLMNGAEINQAILHKDKGTVTVAYARRKGAAAGILHDLYLAALNRPPTAAEVRRLTTILAGVQANRMSHVQDKDPRGPWQDVFWALLNSNEFILNH